MTFGPSPSGLILIVAHFEAKHTKALARSVHCNCSICYERRERWGGSGCYIKMCGRKDPMLYSNVWEERDDGCMCEVGLVLVVGEDIVVVLSGGGGGYSS